MLHLEYPEIRRLLLHGKFGLEKEGLRVLSDASMAQTPNPFPGDGHITMDFSENQTEINTSAEPSAEGAVHALEAYGRRLQKKLSTLPQREYIWPFSNPPYLQGEDDIPIAQFSGELASKTEYRNYLAGRYGKYKMTFSGIHVNYSFSEELLKKEFAVRGGGRSRSFRDSFYLELAEKAAAYGWLLVILTAASPVLDASYFETGQRQGSASAKKVPGSGGFESGQSQGEKTNATCFSSANLCGRGPVSGTDVFSGMASVRCSELGYWNSFTPVFDYTNIQRYSDGIRKYVEDGFLYSASELYYPVRLKPKGENSLDALKEYGVDHLELRMFDINPFTESGMDIRDVQFVQLFLTWLSSMPRRVMSPVEQVLAVQNFKNAAHYDLRTVRIVMRELTGEAADTAEGAALYVLEQMQRFYRGLYGEIPEWVPETLDFQRKKIKCPDIRYAVRVRRQFSGTFLGKGIEQAVRLQEKCAGRDCGECCRSSRVFY